MKYLLLTLLVTSSCLAVTPTRDFPAIYIKGPKLVVGYTIDMIDGTMFNGEKFHNTMKLRTNLNERRFGTKTNQGLVGIYTYNGKKHSLESLIALEKNSETNPQQMQEFFSYLQQSIVPDFLKLTEPFLVDATGAKPAMMALIKEWAEKSGRTNSLLLAWGASREGHESDVVRNQAKTIQDFDQFCADLVYFLETLMRSCKVATQQYKEYLQTLVNNAHK